MEEKKEEALVVWEVDSLEVVRSFPASVRSRLGMDIRRLQRGERPSDGRTMASVGRGVFELRQQDDNGWYRVIYLKKVQGRLFMLHSFMKKSAKTSPRDLNTAKQRLKDVLARLAKEKKDAKENN